MKILTKYILEKFWHHFLLFFLAFVLLFVIVDLFDHLDDFLQYDISLLDLILYYLNFIPEVIVLTIPVAVLLSSIALFRHLSSSNEYVAMVGGGFSLKNMLMPLTASILILGFATFVLDNFIVPATFHNLQKIRAEKFIKKDTDTKKTLSRVRLTGKKNSLIFVEKYLVSAALAEGVTIIENDANNVMQRKIMAEKGRWNGHEWTFENVKVFDMRAGYVEEITNTYPSLIFDLGVEPDDFILSRHTPRSMRLGQLKAFSKRISNKEDVYYLELMVEYYKRFSFAFVPVIILFVSVPFGLMQKRGHKFLSIGIGIVIGLAYYLIFSIFWSFGKGGFLSPFWANWLPHIFFTALAWVMFYVVPK